MSLKAMVWAISAHVTPASHKLILIIMANYVGDDGCCFPSVDTICFQTGQSERTVRSAIDSMLTKKIIKDTGAKVGATSQIKVYCFPDEAREKQHRFKDCKFCTLSCKNDAKDLTKDPPKDCNYCKPAYTMEPITSNHKEADASGTGDKDKDVETGKTNPENPPPTPPPKRPSSPQHDLIVAYSEAYEKAVGEKYLPEPKDYKRAKELASSGWTPVGVGSLAGIGFNLNDNWLRDKAMEFFSFSHHLNAIRAKGKLGVRNGRQVEPNDRHEDIPLRDLGTF